MSGQPSSYNQRFWRYDILLFWDHFAFFGPKNGPSTESVYNIYTYCNFPAIILLYYPATSKSTINKQYNYDHQPTSTQPTINTYYYCNQYATPVQPINNKQFYCSQHLDPHNLLFISNNSTIHTLHPHNLQLTRYDIKNQQTTTTLAIIRYTKKKVNFQACAVRTYICDYTKSSAFMLLFNDCKFFLLLSMK